MNGWDDINIKIEYFLYIYCLSSETLILTVDKFYDHLWQSYMSRLTFLSFGGDENPFVYLWPLHLLDTECLYKWPCLSVGLSVGLSSKNYKKLQNFTKP